MVRADPEAPPPGRPRLLRRVLLVLLAAVAILAIAQVTGLLDVVRDEDRLATAVEDAGLLGPILLVVLMTVLVPVGVPGVPFVLAAGVLWPWPVAAAASLAGGIASSAIGIVAARRLGREALQAKLPRWLAGVDERLTASGIWGVIALRVVLYLIAPADWVIGLSRVPTSTAVIGTAIGLTPTTVGYVVAGPEFFRWLVSPSGLATSVLSLGLAFLVWRWRRARRSGVGAA